MRSLRAARMSKDTEGEPLDEYFLPTVDSGRTNPAPTCDGFLLDVAVVGLSVRPLR